MNYIGRKLFYNKITGDVLKDTGELVGDVQEITYEADIIRYAELLNVPIGELAMISLPYGESADLFNAAGKVRIDPNTLEVILYPYPSITVDKPVIKNDGLDTATITVSVADPVNETVLLEINEQTPNEVQLNEGFYTFTFKSSVIGNYSIGVISQTFGSNSALLEVIEQ